MRSLITRIAVVLCAALPAAACSTEKALESDKPLVVTVDDLGEFGVERSKLSGQEEFNRVKYVDGSLQVEYGFETPDSAAETLFINVTAGFHKTPKDAIDSYKLEKGGAALGVGAVGGVTLKEMPGFYAWGDESYFAHLVGPTGQPGGMLFATRRGTRTYMFMAGGMYFDDAAEWAALIEPRLKYLESYDPLKAKS